MPAITFGADPDADKAYDFPEVVERPIPTPLVYGNAVGDLARYFRWHPKVTIEHYFPESHLLALGASLTRLLESGYSVASIKKAINVFWLTPYSARNRAPTIGFCNKSFQEELLRGEVVTGEEDDVVTWLQTMDREEGMRLPWGPDDDRVIMSYLVTDAYVSRVLHSYPDVVCDILREWGPVCADKLEIAGQQYAWLMGEVGEPPTDLARLSDRIILPRSFLSKTAARPVRESVAAALTNRS